MAVKKWIGTDLFARLDKTLEAGPDKSNDRLKDMGMDPIMLKKKCF
jgi:hypothetical protein